MATQKYLGEDIIVSLKSKYILLENKIDSNTNLIGDIDTLLKTLDTGTGV